MLVLKNHFLLRLHYLIEVNDRLSFLINTEFMSNETTNPTMLFLDRATPLRVHNIEELGYDNKRSYTSNELTIKTPSYNLQGQMNYKISDQWTSQTAFQEALQNLRVTIIIYMKEQVTFHNITDGIVFGRSFTNQIIQKH